MAGFLAAVLAVAGGPVGVLWRFLAPTVPVINAGAGRIVVNDPSPEEYIASDGWFAILGFGFGVVAAIVAWMVVRRYRGPWLLASVVVGCLAASVVAWQAGRLIGLAAYQGWRGRSTQGATYEAPPDLHGYAVLLIPAFAAVILLTLLAGWSNDPNLDRPGARPGYGHDFPMAAPDTALPGAGQPGSGQPGSGQPGSGFSSGSPDAPDPTAEPAPRGPGPAG